MPSTARVTVLLRTRAFCYVSGRKVAALWREPVHPWHDVSWGKDAHDYFNAIVESPEGPKVKYELDKTTGLLRADRVLYSAVHYPANYGFIPQTYCDDGDPLDVLVLCQESLMPLAIVRCRAIGVLPMRDDRGEDDKILAVNIDDPQYTDYHDIAELPQHTLAEVKRFFLDYKVLEEKDVSIDALRGHVEAVRVVEAAIQLYRKKAAELRQSN